MNDGASSWKFEQLIYHRYSNVFENFLRVHYT